MGSIELLNLALDIIDKREKTQGVIAIDSAIRLAANELGIDVGGDMLECLYGEIHSILTSV